MGALSPPRPLGQPHKLSRMSLLAQPFRALRMRLPQPWSLRLGQLVYLPRLLRGDVATRLTFSEEPLIEQLASTKGRLGDGVGAGLSERVVEIPWVLRSLSDGPVVRVLDVGTAFAPVVYKRLLLRLPHRIETVDLADVSLPAITSHVADVRNLPFDQDRFDVATCISTLEHIGMDNAHYHIESGGEDDVEALRELGRVARRILVTVPAGSDESLSWLRQYAPGTFRKRVGEAGLQVNRLDIFAHDSAGGWSIATEDAISDCHFGRGAYAAAAVICAELQRV
jgi:hypothetical protein